MKEFAFIKSRVDLINARSRISRVQDKLCEFELFLIDQQVVYP